MNKSILGFEESKMDHAHAGVGLSWTMYKTWWLRSKQASMPMTLPRGADRQATLNFRLDYPMVMGALVAGHLRRCCRSIVCSRSEQTTWVYLAASSSCSSCYRLDVQQIDWCRPVAALCFFLALIPWSRPLHRRAASTSATRILMLFYFNSVRLLAGLMPFNARWRPGNRQQCCHLDTAAFKLMRLLGGLPSPSNSLSQMAPK